MGEVNGVSTPDSVPAQPQPAAVGMRSELPVNGSSFCVSQIKSIPPIWLPCASVHMGKAWVLALYSPVFKIMSWEFPQMTNKLVELSLLKTQVWSRQLSLLTFCPILDKKYFFIWLLSPDPTLAWSVKILDLTDKLFQILLIYFLPSLSKNNVGGEQNFMTTIYMSPFCSFSHIITSTLILGY